MDKKTVIKIKTVLVKNADYPVSDTLRSDIILKNMHSYDRYAVGGVPKGRSGRKENGGPLVPGPWHYMFGLCTVIDNYGGTGAEMAKARAENRVYDIEPGTKLEIDGLKYVIEKSWNGVLVLRPAKKAKKN